MLTKVKLGKTKKTISIVCNVLYFFSYDDEAERITQYERIVLEDLEKIEIGKCLNAPNLKISFSGKLLPFTFSQNIALYFSISFYQMLTFFVSFTEN